MKKLLYLGIVLICTCLCPAVSAQRYYGQWTISGNAGYGNNGIVIGCTGEKYLSRTLSGVKFGFSLNRKNYSELGFRLPVNKIHFNTSYFYSFEKYMSEYFFLNLGAGLFAGIETIGNIHLPYGVLLNRSKFVYGFTITPQFEFLFRRGSNISGFIEPLISYDLRSRFDKFIYSGSIGIKHYF